VVLATGDPVLEVLALMTDPLLDWCPLCPVPAARDPRFHPDGQPLHRELLGLPVTVLTDTDKRTLLLGLETLARLRTANRMKPDRVEALHARLRAEWFGEGSG
jgi:hypothetical protein